MLVRLSTKGQLIIPKPIRAALDLAPGTRLELHIVGRTIVLEPVEGTPPLDALYGRHDDVDLLGDLEAEHKRELANEQPGP